MANSLCFFASPPTFCCQSPSKNAKPTHFFSVNDKNSSLIQKRPVFQTSKSQSFELKAGTSPPQSTKPNSLVCANCEGNGCVACSQCKGGGVNLTDHFNGQFKAGALCWLCRGKKEVLCGECNGAGFIGGFLSTFDE